MQTSLTIVIGCVDCAQSIRGSLRSMIDEAAVVGAEVIVVDASRDETQSIVEADFPGIRVLTAAPGTLVPELWAQGMRVCGTDMIALSIGHCEARPGWARALVAELDAAPGTVAGAGGVFAIAADASATDRAIFLLRYSAFFAGVREAGVVHDVAADNAAYRRNVLEKYADAWKDGFWEVEFHKRLTKDDGVLRVTPEAIVEFHPRATLRAYFRQRFEHARHFGLWRVRDHGEHPVRVMAAAPLVPAVLLIRIARRSIKAGHGMTFVSALPHLAFLALAWAGGEFRGALDAMTRRAPGSHTASTP